MSTQFSALVSKLKEIFQINRPDLDFGVYRILNARSSEIAEFLDKRLKTKVEQYLGEAKTSLDENTIKELEAELRGEFGKRAFNEQGEFIDAEAIESALGQKYIALTQADANEMTDQSQVYSHLLTFFSRYYDEGDFISQRRYKGDTYAIPYSGEEVMLYWANKDQYYTKSGEMFSNYRFKLNDERSVLFRLVSADTARENRKDNDKDRRFIVVTEPKTFTRIDEDGEEFEETIVPFSIENNELTILFEYATLPKGSKQEALNTESHNKILTANVLTSDWLNDLAQPAPTEKEPKRTVLQKHLSTYTQKNTADYFIHKDLGNFLRNELDFYIKNEVMHLDDVVSADQFIQIERQLSIIKCLRQIGLEIISFLASLEDFQKKLWLKKKFVVSAEYCITLDRVDKSLYAEIAENTAQWQQWEDLGFKGKDIGWRTTDYLKQHQALMVDTSLFSLEFKGKLLQKIDDLDAQTNGLIIQSDNFQALNLINKKYKDKIQCIYIDPPYNTGGDGFLYKDSFKSSTWMSLMTQLLMPMYNLLNEKGAFFSHCDENEFLHYGQILKNFFGYENFIENIVWNKRVPKNDKGIGNIHEYIYVLSKSELLRKSLDYKFIMKKDALQDIYDLVAKEKRAGTSIEETQKKLKKFYKKNGFDRAITLYCELDNNYEIFGKINMSWPNSKTNGPRYEVINPATNKVAPIPDRGWRWNKDTFLKAEADGKEQTLYDGSILKGRIWYSSKNTVQPSSINYLKEVESFLFRSIVSLKSDGSILLANMGLDELISYPKPLNLATSILYANQLKNDLVLDCFAGSGTTAHGLINLNREYNLSNNYILIEQSDNVQKAIKPRIQKVIYSSDWLNGKPTNPESGISHCLKVVKLESYEDTLNNLELVRKGTQQNLLTEQQASTKLEDQKAYNDYLMHYMLELESKDSLLNVKDFQKPFSYQMNITTDSAGAFERKNIDLVETFNYLIGLNVQLVDYQLERGFVTVEGLLRTGEKTLIIWRDCEKIGYQELDDLLQKRLKVNPKDKEYKLIYINGDHNIPSPFIKIDGEQKQLKVRSIEQTFLKNMFEE